MFSRLINNKISMFLHTTLPNKIPEFNINEVDEPLFFVYINDDKITFISHKQKAQNNETIKVGIEDNEFIFYPANKDSIFFKNHELDTSNFIKAIICNDIHIIANNIYNQMALFSNKLIEHKNLYIQKLTNINFSINIVDDSKIFHINKSLYNTFTEMLKNRLIEILHTNILDTPLNIFANLFPDGIYDVKTFMKNSYNITATMLQQYINKSDLAPVEMQDIERNINDKIFVITYMINSLLMQSSESKKIYVNADIHINNIDAFNLQPDNILYSNNGLKVLVQPNQIAITNQTDKNLYIKIHSKLESEIYPKIIDIIIDSTTINKNSNKIIDIDKNINLIKNLNSDIVSHTTIKHSIDILYSFDGKTTNKLLGSSKYTLDNVLANINTN